MADYRLTQSLGAMGDDDGGAAQGGEKGRQDRSCYSFCMCPGGQVVPTSVDPKEVALNALLGSLLYPRPR